MPKKYKLKKYWRYWGKASPGQDALNCYHLLVYHSLDVAAVGWALLDENNSLCQSLALQLEVDSPWLKQWFTFCLALHDLGKFFRSFQNLCPNLSENLVPYTGGHVYSVRHDTLGFALWRNLLSHRLTDVIPLEHHRIITQWLEIVCGHHGQPPDNLASIRSYLTSDDEDAAEEYIRDVIDQWTPDLKILATIDKGALKRASWQLAGVAVLADWLGSNQEIFTYHNELDTLRNLSEYWRDVALPQAQKALEIANINRSRVNPFNTIKQQFPFVDDATPLQRFAERSTLGSSQQLYILEDVTGAGKTEAAMVLVHRLMTAGLATGVYVGLPTMATANSMYRRMSSSYRQLFTPSSLPSLVLAHGARNQSKEFQESVILSEQLFDKNYSEGEPTASALCNYWLADNRKKALLAEIGVGTIDQALLGVLPARHQSLRMLGLSTKVLVVDEVHAFDPYMIKLLTTLLTAHAAQGGSAILLSATLPRTMREQFVSAFNVGAGFPFQALEKIDYPLVTHSSGNGLVETALPTRESVKRRVSVVRMESQKEPLSLIRNTVKEGACLCWIRNTVKDAQDSYHMLLENDWVDKERITLFHSRFAMVDRQRIEEDVVRRFGKRSGAAERSGRILISTQVVEQSLDLDFDVMITDLAPIDLIIQRAGRLQRHLRKRNGDLLVSPESADQRPPPVLYVLAQNPEDVQDKGWLRALLPGTQAVYPNVGQLWLTIHTLFRKNGFSMPEDARELIEGVYSSEAQQNIPELLLDASLDAEAGQKAKSSMGEFNSLKMEKGYTRSSAGLNGGWDDDTHIPTRLSSDSVTVVLVKPTGDGKLIPYADAQQHVWALSQLSLPTHQWNAAERLIPTHMTRNLEELTEANKHLKFLKILPIAPEYSYIYSSTTGWIGAGNSMQEKK